MTKPLVPSGGPGQASGGGNPAKRAPRTRRSRRAFSLAEVVVATLIVGIMLVAAMRVVGAAVRGRITMANRERGVLLARQLTSEILQADYQEPDESSVFGPEASETGGTRAAFDDVDDYHNWNASPPQQKDGSPIPDRANWRRTVAVEWVNRNSLTQVIAADQGVKRITVTASRNGQVMATLVTVRSVAWQQPPYE